VHTWWCLIVIPPRVLLWGLYYPFVLHSQVYSLAWLNIESLGLIYELGCRWRLFVLALYRSSILIIERNRSANKLLTRLLCLIHKLLMMQCYIRVSGDSSGGARWHCNTCMIIECEWFSFLSCHSWRWLMLIWKLLLVAIWIKRGIIDKLRILGCCSWYWVIVSFWRRTIHRRRLRPHRLLAKLLC